MRAIILIIGALLFIGCTTSANGPLIEYRRTGGFAGLDDRLVIKENGEAILTRKSRRMVFTLDNDTIKSLQTLFVETGFAQLGPVFLPPQRGADLFEYVVTYKGHTVRTMDGAIPSALDPVLEALDAIIERHGS